MKKLQKFISKPENIFLLILPTLIIIFFGVIILLIYRQEELDTQEQIALQTQSYQTEQAKPTPTKTPTPTKIPTPKPTENTYCPPDEVAEAISKFEYIMEKYNNSMKRMEDPSNNNWLEVNELGSLAERASRMDVPDCLSNARFHLKNALQGTELAISAFMDGYDLAAEKYKEDAIDHFKFFMSDVEEVMDCLPNCTRLGY